MNKQQQQQQQKILNKIESMVNNWNSGNIMKSQKDYEYVMGFCESANYDFQKTLTQGLHKLMMNCVGVLDTQKYIRYINGV